MPLGVSYDAWTEWSPLARGYALAWRRNQRATCSGCGTRSDEWADDDDAYISDHLSCPGCLRLAEEKAQNLDKQPDGRIVPGQHAYLIPKALYQPKALPEHPLHLPGPDDD